MPRRPPPVDRSLQWPTRGEPSRPRGRHGSPAKSRAVPFRIDRLHLAGDDLVADLTGPVEPDVVGRLVVVVGPLTADPSLVARAVERLSTLPCLVVATAADPTVAPFADLVDMTVADDGELADVASTFEATPLASQALAIHLRGTDRRSVFDGLVAESAVFSALQAGPEHLAWRTGHQRRERAAEAAPVRTERVGNDLTITLDRPHVRNAVSAALRDELLAALAVAEADPALHVHLRGAGSDFSAGGDLDEFGTVADPASGHLLRLRRSLAAALHRIAPRTTAHLHGAAFGAGIELAAFAGTVVAASDTRVGLPELRLGLIPGAGGTVSLPARIGRHRTAWLALTRRPVDAATARTWGLVDRISG